MLGYRGRSAHVTKVPGKPEPNGFKVWVLCEKGYMFDWLYYSGSEETLDAHPQLTNTGAGVLTLALNLPYNDYNYAIFMDNLFTSYELLSTLRSYGIGAVGTGEVRARILQIEDGEPVLVIIWQDQAVVRILPTIHDAMGFILQHRRRPRVPTNMNPATKAIFTLPPPQNHDFLTPALAKRFLASKLALPVTIPIDDYNYNMN
ncbi:hypothetical protein ACEPPN_017063 [Leptodophora sp. 'Broadleaf-Isolate-01']